MGAMKTQTTRPSVPDSPEGGPASAPLATRRPSRLRLPTVSNPLVAVFVGVVCARVWITLVFADPGTAVGAGPFSHDVFDVAFTLLNCAVALLARRLVPLSSHRWTGGVALIGMFAVSVAFSVGLYIALPGCLAVAFALLGGVSYAVFLLLNAEAYAGMSLLRIVLVLSGTRVTSSFLTFLFETADAPRLTALLCVLPLLAVGSCRAAYLSLPVLDRQPSLWAPFSYPWKIFAIVAIFSFAYGLHRTSLADGAGQHASLSTALAMGAVFLSVYFFSDRLDVAALCRAPVPLMICGLLLMPTSWLFGQVASSYLISIAYTLATMSMGVLVYDMAKRTGVPVVPLMAVSNAMQGFVVAGASVSRVVQHTLSSAAAGGAVGALTCVVLAVSFLLLFSERELASRWGIEVLARASLDDDAVPDRLALRCDEVARTFGLTPREAQVLLELARRRPTDAIARDLVIAPGTLKVHKRHVYEKLGVHSRDELAELLGLSEG